MTNILVIDDNTVHRMVICRIAKQAGYAVTEASSFDEAKALLEELSYSCIALDLSLGNHGGVEVLRLLAKRNSPAAVIVISGAEEQIRTETMTLAKTLGVDVHATFPKPVDLARLRVLLGEVKDRIDVGLLAAAS
jgi:CheY-like chemotaxis protein